MDDADVEAHSKKRSSVERKPVFTLDLERRHLGLIPGRPGHRDLSSLMLPRGHMELERYIGPTFHLLLPWPHTQHLSLSPCRRLLSPTFFLPPPPPPPPKRPPPPPPQTQPLLAGQWPHTGRSSFQGRAAHPRGAELPALPSSWWLRRAVLVFCWTGRAPRRWLPRPPPLHPSRHRLMTAVTTAGAFTPHSTHQRRAATTHLPAAGTSRGRRTLSTQSLLRRNAKTGLWTRHMPQSSPSS